MIDCYTNYFIQGFERKREREREREKEREREGGHYPLSVSTIVVLLSQLILIVMVTNTIICKWHPKRGKLCLLHVCLTKY